MHFQSEHDDMSTIAITQYHEELAPIIHPLTLKEGTEQLVHFVTELYCDKLYLQRFHNIVSKATQEAIENGSYELDFDDSHAYDDLYEAYGDACDYEATHLRPALDSEDS